MTWLSTKTHFAGVRPKQLSFLLDCNKMSASSSTANTEFLSHTNLLLPTLPLGHSIAFAHRSKLSYLCLFFLSYIS